MFARLISWQTNGLLEASNALFETDKRKAGGYGGHPQAHIHDRRQA